MTAVMHFTRFQKLKSKEMWWFKKNTSSPIADETSSELLGRSDEDNNIMIPKDKFILDENSTLKKSNLPLYEIYKRLQEDWETRGYNDAISFPDTSYRENQKRVIIDQLRLAIKEALLHYDDKIIDIEIHIDQAQKNGLMETCGMYIQEKKKLDAHHAELSVLNKDAEDIGEKTKPILTSYDMGFARGLVSLSNEKVSEIMSK